MDDEYTHHNYWESIRSTAKEIIDEVEDEDERSDRMHEETDGSRWVFVYWGAHHTLEHTSNKDAWGDIYSDFSEMTQGCNSVEDVEVRMAFHAYYADLSEAINDLIEEQEAVTS